MKKTIAILLILVIGMVGVFAATAPNAQELHLKTTVVAINEMHITEVDGEPEWTSSFGSNSEVSASSTAYGGATYYSEITLDETLQTVGELHTRTNNRNTITVKITATALETSTTTTGDGGTTTTTIDDTIHYTVTGGNVSNASYHTGLVNGNPLAAVAFHVMPAGSGLRDLSTDIEVTLDSGVAKKTAGEYTGYITFNYNID